MHIPSIIFTKVPLSPTTSRILFCIVGGKLPEFDLVKYSPTELATQNGLVRHDKFDWHVNKNRPICYTFEKESGQENNLPVHFTNFMQNNLSALEWLIFPQAVKKLSNGTHRNLLQLVVQYISYGMIDESLIAADYDAEWLRELQSSKKE
jgi:hypothetical protein